MTISLRTRFNLILASEVGDGIDPIGHAWVAVEYPHDQWLVRGFYPEGLGLGIITGTTGRIRDDWDTFRTKNLRTRTFRECTDRQVMNARKRIMEYGGSLSDPKAPSRRGRRPTHMSGPDQPSTVPYSLAWNQCCTFAIDVCRAAGFDPIPFMPQAPVALWRFLGTAGEQDARQLPPPFGEGNWRGPRHIYS